MIERKLLLGLGAFALLLSTPSLAEEHPETGERKGRAPTHEEAHHFCEHAAAHYKINWFDLFHYKSTEKGADGKFLEGTNARELEECIESVIHHGEVVLPARPCKEGEEVPAFVDATGKTVEAHTCQKGEILPAQANADGNPVTKPEVDIHQAMHHPNVHRPTLVGPPYFFALINFAILLYVLIRYTREPLQRFLDARYTTIKKELEESTTRFQQAQARLAEYEERLKNMDEARRSLEAQYQEQAQKEVERMKEDTARQVAKFQADAKRDIDNAILNAEKSIRREAVEAAITMAEKILTKELGDDDRKRLAEQFVQRISSQKPRSGGDV